MVHLTPALFGEGGVFGGAERYSWELARHMTRVVPTTLVTFGDRPRRFTTPDGLTVRVLGPAWHVRGQRFNPVHPGIVRAVAGADVVHCHQPHTLAAELAALLARLRQDGMRHLPAHRRPRIWRKLASEEVLGWLRAGQRDRAQAYAEQLIRTED